MQLSALLIVFLPFGCVWCSTEFSCSDPGASICLPNGYDKTQPPSNVRNVSILFHIHEISFNPHEMELDLSMDIKWRDERIYNIAETESILDSDFVSSIWFPRISALSEKYMREKPGSEIVRLSSKDNVIVYMRRFKYKISCYMNFNDFPFDDHECSFMVGSFQDGNEYFTTEGVFNDSPNTALVSVVRALNERESSYILPSGEYSMAGFVVNVERRLVKYIVFYYVPCVFISLGVWLMILWGNTYEERFLFLVFVSVLLLYILNAASHIVPCNATDFTTLEIWIMIHVSFLAASFLELKVSHWLYLRSYSARVALEHGSRKSKIDVAYFFLYFFLYSALIGGYIAFVLLI